MLVDGSERSSCSEGKQETEGRLQVWEAEMESREKTCENSKLRLLWCRVTSVWLMFTRWARRMRRLRQG